MALLWRALFGFAVRRNQSGHAAHCNIEKTGYALERGHHTHIGIDRRNKSVANAADGHHSEVQQGTDVLPWG